MKLQGLVKHFENNNEEYTTIRKTAEGKVHSTLSDQKMVLKLALLSLTESMRKDPDKYSHLIHNNNTSSTPRIQATDYDSASYGQQQQYLSQAYADMLLEQAEKLYNKLAKELGDEIISDYAASTSSSSLPVLSQSDEKGQQPRPLLQKLPEAEDSQYHIYNTRHEDDDDNEHN